MSKDKQWNDLVNTLVSNMLGMALDDVTCGDDSWQYHRNAVEAFDELPVEQRERARRIYRYILSKNTHYASGAPFNPADYVNVWLSDRIDEGPIPDDWLEDWDGDDE